TSQQSGSKISNGPFQCSKTERFCPPPAYPWRALPRGMDGSLPSTTPLDESWSGRGRRFAKNVGTIGKIDNTINNVSQDLQRRLRRLGAQDLCRAVRPSQATPWPRGRRVFRQRQQSAPSFFNPHDITTDRPDFHCDRGGTVPLALLAAFLEAKIALTCVMAA